MSEDVEIPGIPGTSVPRNLGPEEGLLDASLDIDLGDGTNGEVRRAYAGLDGDWEAGSYSATVDWSDPLTYDDDGGWDNAILLDDEY